MVTPVQELKAKLNAAKTNELDQSLRTFLFDKIFIHSSLMFDQSHRNHTNESTLARRLYSLYSTSGVSLRERETQKEKQKEMLRFVENLKPAGLRAEYQSVLSSIRLQSGMTLEAFLTAFLGTDFSNANARDVFDKACHSCDDFIHFNLQGQRPKPTYRVYANVKYDKLIDVVRGVLEYIATAEAKTPKKEIYKFKITTPAGARRRDDAMVIYCLGVNVAKTIAAWLLEKLGRKLTGGDIFNGPTPKMTQLIGPGVAIGAEPKYQGTGLGGPDGNTTSQSFGTLRCQAIAAAILGFQEDPATVKNFELFCKYVWVAFSEFVELNPRNASV